MDGRTQVFARLKPLCVALHKSALELNGPNPDQQAVAQRLEDLKHALGSITTKLNALDEKIAEYVFVPVSHVLKFSQRASLRCLELTFQCLAILIDQGWKSRMQPELAAQVVILCTLLSEKNPRGLATSESTPELQTSALWCLYHTFAVLAANSDAKAALTSESNFPQLGQTITVILNALENGAAIELQVAAMSALKALMNDVATRDVQAAFLPGIVSKLTRVVTPQTKQRRNHTVIIGCLEILDGLFRDTLSGPHGSAGNVNGMQSRVIDAAWRENASTQLRPALANIVRLKEHSRGDVREALLRFCIDILKECRSILANCADMVLETVLLLSVGESGTTARFEMEFLIKTDPTVSSLVQNTLYDWFQSLPTKMQAADEQAKVQRLQQISTAYSILKAGQVDTTTLDHMLAGVLRDSMMITLQDSGLSQSTATSDSPLRALDLAAVQDQHNEKEFTSSLVKHKGQQNVIDAIQQLARRINSSSMGSFAADMARSLSQSHGDSQIASFWLLLDVTKSMMDGNDNIDALMNFTIGSAQEQSQHIEELYSLSLDVLNYNSEDTPDSRLQALSLRTLAFRAQELGAEFRYELIDALYPVLHALATPDQLLQQDSITTLNIYTASCGYSSVKDLIVDNVDYLTNAVALKLNAFDVSPQAPQVLLMMIRLAGPSLLPYLEDTIESIFAALEDFHGYPLLVELLFRVLSVVADEGAKAPQLAIADGKNSLRVVTDSWQSVTITDLAATLRDRMENTLPPNTQEVEPHPRKPWESIEDADGDDDENAEEDQIQPSEDSEKPPPAQKTYNLLLKISDLTQHFLPSASPTLRASLLTLIKTTIPALARHENSFLPLINTLWPEVTSRLDDTVPHIVANALDVISMLCEHAGDFMRNRVLQVWPRIVDIHREVVKDIIQETTHRKTVTSSTLDDASTVIVQKDSRLKHAINHMRSTPAQYRDTGTRIIWTALMDLIAAAVRHVSLPPEAFDDALEMVTPMLDDPDITQAFETQNADAVWLTRMRTGSIPVPKQSVIDECLEFGFVAVSG